MLLLSKRNVVTWRVRSGKTGAAGRLVGRNATLQRERGTRTAQQSKLPPIQSGVPQVWLVHANVHAMGVVAVNYAVRRLSQNSFS